MEKPFYARNAFKILLVVAFALPVTFWSAFLAVRSNTNDVTEWLPDSFIETDELNWFRDYFVGDAFILISWEGCTLGGDPVIDPDTHDDLRLETLALKLAPAEGSQSASLSGTSKRPRYFGKVMTGRRALDKLTSEPLNVPYDEAVRRLTGSLIGPVDPDHPDAPRQTCLIVTLTDLTKGNLRAVLGRGTKGPLGFGRGHGVLFDILKEECDLDAEIVRLGGPPVDNVAIDEEGEKTLLRLAGLSGLVGLGLSWLTLRSVRLTLLVFACGVLSGVVSLAIVYHSGFRMDAILMSMPAVVYVLGLSGAIHIVNYYRDAINEHGITGAAERAIGHGWRPCLIAAVTTAMGLGSLYTSDLIPIQKFGLFSAIGVMATLVVLFTYLPACLQYGPSPHPQPKQKPKRKPQPIPNSDTPAAGELCSEPSIWMRAGVAITEYKNVVLAVCLAASVFFAFGLPKMKPNVEILKLFDANSRIIADYGWLEKKLGNLVPMEVVVPVDASRMAENYLPAGATETLGKANVRGDRAYYDAQGNYLLNFLDRIELAMRLQQRVESLANIDRAMSAATFYPHEPNFDVTRIGGIIPLPPDSKQRLRRKKLNQRLTESRQEFLDTDYFREDPASGAELWRVSARVEALSGVDYSEFVKDIKNRVEPVLAVYGERNRISRQLRKAGKSLDGSKVCLLGLGGEDGDAINAEDYQLTLMLADLLRSGGAKVQYNDPYVPRLFPGKKRNATDRLYHLANLASRPLSDLPHQDCVILLHDRKQYDAGQLKATAESAGGVFIDSRKFAPNYVATAEKDREQFVAAHQLGSKNIKFGPDLSAVYTGVVPLVYKTQWALLDGLSKSVGWAFIMIAVVMMLQLRNGMAGFLSMIPNLFPVVVVFGFMGWMGISVDIGTVMAASVGLGVAVDDTVHFLTWFRDGMDQGLGRRRSVILAYQRCGRAMMQTTLIAGCGLAVFAISTFTPTQRFGYMMLTLLAAALVGDLVFLPAMLCGPVGRFFGKSKNVETSGRSALGDAVAADSVSNSQPSASYHKPSVTPQNLASSLGKRSSRRPDGPHRSFGK